MAEINQYHHRSSPFPWRELTVFVLSVVFVVLGVFGWQQWEIRRTEAKYNSRIGHMNVELTKAETQASQTRVNLRRAEAELVSLESEKADLLAQSCLGYWYNNECLPTNCVDSDSGENSEGRFTFGSVTFISGNGVESSEADACDESGSQLQEKWCYESPSRSGNAVPGLRVIRCDNGCVEGACLRNE
ncbi:MAG: hypothetical protein Q8Q20_02820 [bacterium]|nr:hypothetical protein [bacterium]